MLSTLPVDVGYLLMELLTFNDGLSLVLCNTVMHSMYLPMYLYFVNKKKSTIFAEILSASQEPLWINTITSIFSKAWLTRDLWATGILDNKRPIHIRGNYEYAFLISILVSSKYLYHETLPQAARRILRDAKKRHITVYNPEGDNPTTSGMETCLRSAVTSRVCLLAVVEPLIVYE